MFVAKNGVWATAKKSTAKPNTFVWVGKDGKKTTTQSVPHVNLPKAVAAWVQAPKVHAHDGGDKIEVRVEVFVNGKKVHTSSTNSRSKKGVAGFGDHIIAIDGKGVVPHEHKDLLLELHKAHGNQAKDTVLRFGPSKSKKKKKSTKKAPSTLRLRSTKSSPGIYELKIENSKIVGKVLPKAKSEKRTDSFVVRRSIDTAKEAPKAKPTKRANRVFAIESAPRLRATAAGRPAKRGSQSSDLKKLRAELKQLQRDLERLEKSLSRKRR